MDEFNLRTLCNELMGELTQSVGDKNIIKLSVDIQLQERFKGDVQQLKQCIKEMALFISSNLINGVIHIEVLKESVLSNHVNLCVQLTGTGSFRNKGPMDGIEAEKKFKNFPFLFSRHSFHDHVIFEFIVSLLTTGEISRKVKARFADKKILIAEDNEINAMVFSSFLEEWGCDVTVVINGAEAIAILQDASFDAVLMDIYMPVLNGNKATAKIREFNSTIPIISLTASTDDDEFRLSKEAGCNDFLLKPVSSTHLYQVLSKYL
jgi:CheY-like chemotaxis protein